jgi:hypothetical protein
MQGKGGFLKEKPSEKGEIYELLRARKLGAKIYFLLRARYGEFAEQTRGVLHQYNFTNKKRHHAR